MVTTYHHDGIHVVDQSGQPYGSNRRCCNMCGAMLVNGMHLLDNLSEWWSLPESERCARSKEGAK